MRHRVKTKKLNMDVAARKALVLNLTKSIIQHEDIETTLVKAKYVKPKVEKLITKARNKDLATRKLLLSRLRDKATVKKLLEELGPRFANRNGGYLRIQRTTVRKGDNAQLARIMFVEKSESKKSVKSRDKVVVKKDKEEVVVKDEKSKDKKSVKKVEKKSKTVKKESK